MPCWCVPSVSFGFCSNGEKARKRLLKEQEKRRKKCVQSIQTINEHKEKLQCLGVRPQISCKACSSTKECCCRTGEMQCANLQKKSSNRVSRRRARSCTEFAQRQCQTSFVQGCACTPEERPKKRPQPPESTLNVTKRNKKAGQRYKRKKKQKKHEEKKIVLHMLSFASCGQCDFVFEPPKKKQLEPKTACLGIDKLIQEERDNHEWNVAFQKALVKRLEASERRITMEDYLDDEEDYSDAQRARGKGRGRKRKRPKEAAPEKVSTDKAAADTPLPTAQPVFPETKCACSKKIAKEERKRKTFVRILEKEQAKFERLNRKAQLKYEKKRMKAYKKCENTQLATERGYFKGSGKGMVDKAEETFSVFIHMDPGACGCRGRAACCAKFKKCFFPFCVWFYIFGFIIFFVVTYVLTQL